MKQQDENKSVKAKKEQQDSSGRGRTKVPGQNPQANDDPSHDENNDENRRP